VTIYTQIQLKIKAKAGGHKAGTNLPWLLQGSLFGTEKTCFALFSQPSLRQFHETSPI